MSKVEMRITGLDVQQVRAVAAAMSRHRYEIPDHQGRGIRPCWAPTIHCEGPDLFALYTPSIPLDLASILLRTADGTLGQEARDAVELASEVTRLEDEVERLRRRLSIRTIGCAAPPTAD